MRGVAGLALVLGVFAACDGDSNIDRAPTAQPTPTAATATQRPESPTPAGSPTGVSTTTGGLQAVPSTVQLVDATAGTVRTLVSSTTDAAWSASFEGDRVTVQVGQNTRQFSLDGTALPALPAPAVACRQVGESAEIAGRVVAGVQCGVSSVSPDGRWMTYPVQTGNVALQNGYPVPVWDQWLVDLRSGASSMIQPGLLHCGGCDGRYGPRWSISSRYVVFAELGGDGRRFLTEVASATTRPIGTGSEVTYAPAWSPLADLLVYSSPPGTATVLLDPSAGTSRRMELAWPVAFDASGTLLYSPAWSTGPKEPAGTTTVIEIATGKVVASLAGAASWTRSQTWSRPPSPSVVVTPDGIMAALQGAPSCAGTAIYLGSKLQHCIVDGVDAALGSGGVIAVARHVGSTGRAKGPGFETLSLERYEIDVIQSGRTRTVLRDVLSFGPPPMEWDAAGTRVLVRWPFSGGL